MLHRQIGGLSPPQYFIDVAGSLPKQVRRIEPVGDQTTPIGKKCEWIDGGQPIPFCKRDDEPAIGEGDDVRCNDETDMGLASERLELAFNIGAVMDIEARQFNLYRRGRLFGRFQVACSVARGAS